MQNKKYQVDEILESLDGMTRAEAPGFFYTRLKARMLSEEKSVEQKQQNWLLRPPFALGITALLIILNVMVLLQKSKGESAVETDSIQTIAAEYNLSETTTPTYYLALEK